MLQEAGIQRCIDEEWMMSSGQEGSTISDLIRASGKSYRELAEEIGVSRGTIGNWKADNRVTEGNFEAFASAVGVSAERVREISGPPEPAHVEPTSDAQVNAWRDAALEASPDPYIATILHALPLFRDPETLRITVSVDKIAGRTPLEADQVRERWPEVLSSDLVERIPDSDIEALGVWMLRLVLPDRTT